MDWSQLRGAGCGCRSASQLDVLIFVQRVLRMLVPGFGYPTRAVHVHVEGQRVHAPHIGAVRCKDVLASRFVLMHTAGIDSTIKLELTGPAAALQIKKCVLICMPDAEKHADVILETLQ